MHPRYLLIYTWQNYSINHQSPIGEPGGDQSSGECGLLLLLHHPPRQKGMPQHLLRSDPFPGIRLQHPPQKVHRHRVHITVKIAAQVELESPVVLVQFLKLPPLEERSADE